MILKIVIGTKAYYYEAEEIKVEEVAHPSILGATFTLTDPGITVSKSLLAHIPTKGQTISFRALAYLMNNNGQTIDIFFRDQQNPRKTRREKA